MSSVMAKQGFKCCKRRSHRPSSRSWVRKNQTLLTDNDCYYLYFIFKIVKLHFKSLNFWQFGSTRKLTHKSVNIYPYMDWSPSDFSALEFSRQEYWSGYSLQGIVPTQRSNLGLLHCRCIVYYLSCQGSPIHLFT